MPDRYPVALVTCWLPAATVTAAYDMVCGMWYVVCVEEHFVTLEL